MKLSVRGASTLVLALAVSAATSIAACADAEDEPFVPPQADGGDAMAPDEDADAAAAPDGSVEAGTKLCSDHGFCRTDVPTGQTLTGVWGDGTGVVWAVTLEGNVLRWDGKAWKMHASGLGPLVSIWGSGPTDVWVGGDEGVLHGSGATSASLTFAEVPLPGEPARVASVWGIAAGDVWAAGTSDDPDTGMTIGRVLRMVGATDAGPQWEDVAIAPEMLSCSRVWGNAATGVWAACTRPLPADPIFEEMVILRRHGGDDFVEVPMPVDPDDDPLLSGPGTLGGAVAVANSAVWIFGLTGTQWPTAWHGTSADGGETFTFTQEHQGEQHDPQTRAVFGTAPNDVWAVGEYGRARHWNGTTWSTVAITNTQVPIIDPFYAVWSGGPSEVWFVGKQIALRFDSTQEKDGGVQ